MKTSLKLIVLIVLLTFCFSKNLMMIKEAHAEGLLTHMDIILSNNAISQTAVNFTATFKTTTALVANDKFVITFTDPEGFNIVTNGQISAVIQADASLPIVDHWVNTDQTYGIEGGESTADYWTINLRNSSITAGYFVKIYVSGQLNTPITPGLYSINIKSTNSTGTIKDSADGNVLITNEGVNNRIQITSNIDPTLSLILSTNDCTLSTMSDTALKTCGYTINVSTNATLGYTAYIKTDEGFISGAHEISPASYIEVGSEGYGVFSSNAYATISYNTTNCSELNNSTDPISVSQLSNSNQIIAASNSPVNEEQTTVCHVVSISSITPAGTYSQIATLTIVGNF